MEQHNEGGTIAGPSDAVRGMLRLLIGDERLTKMLISLHSPPSSICFRANTTKNSAAELMVAIEEALNQDEKAQTPPNGTSFAPALHASLHDAVNETSWDRGPLPPSSCRFSSLVQDHILFQSMTPSFPRKP